MDFTQDEPGFVFKPRNLVTRSEQPIEKMPEVPSEKKNPTKKRKIKEPVLEKSEIAVLQEK